MELRQVIEEQTHKIIEKGKIETTPVFTDLNKIEQHEFRLHGQ